MLRALMLFQMLSAFIIAGTLAFAVSRRVGLGLFAILAAGVANTLAAFVPITEVSGTKVYAADAIFAILGFAWLWRCFQRRPWTIVDAIWLCFGICILFSWARGVTAYGLNTSTNSMRNFLYLWVGVAYVASFAWTAKDLRFVHRFWVGTSFVLLLIMLSRYFYPLYGIDLAFTGGDHEVNRVFESERDFTALRVLDTSEALFLAQTALLSMVVVGRRQVLDWSAALVPVWFGLVILLQHRTVWVMTALCLILLIPRTDLRRPQLLGLTATATMVAIILSVLAASPGENMVIKSLTGAVSEVTYEGQSTFYFRTELWRSYLDSFQRGTLLEHVFGQPFGSVVFSWIRVGVNLVMTDVFPHNFYIYALYFTGFSGILCVVATLVFAVVGAWRLNPAESTLIQARDWAILLGGQLVYAITYGLEIEQSIVIGVGMGLFATSIKPVVHLNYGAFAPTYVTSARTNLSKG